MLTDMVDKKSSGPRRGFRWSGKYSGMSSIWIPPSGGLVKINFDVGFVEPKCYQVTVVARKEADGCLCCTRGI